jgi:L-ascorbate 6-phosphate lactonase
MHTLAQRIQETEVGNGAVALFWLAQAGFAFKTSTGRIAYIDPYLSDAVERAFGLKRMMSCPISADEAAVDFVLCTHEHLDHLDTDALPVIARNNAAHFAGPRECVRIFREVGIAEDRCHLLEEGKQIEVAGVCATGMHADHGDSAPDAIGIMLDFDGIKIYHTGDTAYRPRELQAAVRMRPDVLLPCINGRYGNLNSEEAALLARDVNPRIVIASHFWMFVEHDGDPAGFLESCAKLAPGVQAMVMKPGEVYVYRKPAAPAVAY